MQLRFLICPSLLLAAALLPVPEISADDGTAAHDHAVVQSLLRIPGAKIEAFPSQKGAVLRHLERLQADSPDQYVTIARQLGVREKPGVLLEIVHREGSGQAAIDAAGLLLNNGEKELLQSALHLEDDRASAGAAAAIGAVNSAEAAELLKPVMLDASRHLSVRSAAASGLGRSWFGQQILLDLARQDEVPEAVRFEVSDALLGSWTKEIANEAKKLASLSSPAAAQSEPIPPVNQLIRMRGDAAEGKKVFDTIGTCAKCHKVRGVGNDVGPDLSEIGSKLSREDLYVNILNPSAAVSHNYETYSLLTVDGTSITGILVNQTDAEVTLKTADAILKTVAADDVEQLKKQSISLMPADLQKNLTVQNLLDLVDYLVLLRKVDESPFHVLASADGNATAGSVDSHDPKDAIAGLEIAPGLRVQLFASEPQMLSPTAIDVDHLGRVWVCEAVNYRHFRNPYNEERSEGDRILVVEDTDHDGAADKTTVFYQGTDIDSPHGVCVLGDRVIVSAGDRVIVFRDTDGDLKPDEKVSLFTGISGVQHDHGIHSFMPGPDGKLYFNFGNEGKQIYTPDGKPVVDLAGNVINDSRNPYQQGMVFRCDPDGSNVETLGWNFRNNWEVCVDSFGTMWQSDNDDDGNRGVRINYVMEYGDYGYRDQRTGATWQTPRIGMRKEIGERHWHLNDPGVIPNVLQTGAGSPTGIILYEGDLLPEPFQNQMIHCDPGPNVVRAYPVEDDGAGYKASIMNLVQGVRDQWFRPVDVCAAPDGSLIIADWYDPGVGGHRMGDSQRGRLFRITTDQQIRYEFPEADFTTFQGAAKALASPNQSTRYLAGQAIQKFWTASPPKLDDYLSIEKVPSARMRARWLWQLARLPQTSQTAIETALSDPDRNVRIAAVRAARQHPELDRIQLVTRLIDDPSPQVRRELAISLRGVQGEAAADLWTRLALAHDGKDRWYLEALGIGAEGQWDGFFANWIEQVGDDWKEPRHRDVIWRARTPAACEYLGAMIRDTDSVEEQERYFRALDLQEGDERLSALRSIVSHQ